MKKNIRFLSSSLLIFSIIFSIFCGVTVSAKDVELPGVDPDWGIEIEQIDFSGSVEIISCGEGQYDFKHNGLLLNNGDDYTLDITPNGDKFILKITGINLYTGEQTFTVDDIDIQKECTHSYDDDFDSVCNKCDFERSIIKAKLSAAFYTYTGKVRKPSAIVADSEGKLLREGTDYVVEYPSGRKDAGIYYVKIKLQGKYSGEKIVSFEIKPINISSDFSIKLSNTSYTYNGEKKTPSVVVKNSRGTTLKKDVHYTVTYPSGRKNVGGYSVKVKMQGNYSGERILDFKIKPRATSVSKLTAGNKQLKVYITKRKEQISGYHIQYSTSKTFKTYKTKSLSGYKTTTATLKGLSAKKTYYVRVRTYKLVDGVRYYSTWSTYKYMKTK